MKHVLLIRFSSLGDIVLSTSVVAHIRSRYPQCEISFVTAEPFDKILKDHPLIDRVIPFNRKKSPLKELIKNINSRHQEKNIDLILDLHSSLRSWALTLRLWFAPVIRVHKRTLLRNLLVWIKKDFLNGKHQVDRLREDFSFILQSKSRTEVSKYLNRSDRGVTSLKKINLTPNKRNIVIAPGASFKPKAWPVERFKKLIELLKLNNPEVEITLVGSNAENEWLNFSDSPVNNMMGVTSLTELVNIIGSAQLVICNDSAVGHIGEALEKKVICIMGPTHESFGFALHTDHGYILSHTVSCRPCSTKGNRNCHRDEAYCFTQTQPEEVYRLSQRLMDE